MFVKEKNEKIEKLLKKLSFLKVVIPIVGIIIANFQLFEFARIGKNLGIKFIIFDVILNFVIIYQLINNLKQEKETQKMLDYTNYLKDRNESLMELNDSIRCFKHDFNNIIQAIDGYIMIGNMEALKKYFSKLLDECNHVKNLEILTLSSVKDPAIYGVLLNKYKLAEAKNVNMNIDVATDLSNIGEKSYPLSRVMGILLDNAIEASLDCEEKFINVQFMQYDTNTKKIIIENTYKDKGIDIEKIFKKEFTSKKSKGNSGLGLWEAKSILGKESKIWLETTKDSKMFKQELDIVLS